MSETDLKRQGYINQRSAADPGRSVWVTANAGTGKTRALVDRMIRLLMTGTPPTRILCLTFTKAAAAEMANRLFEELGALSVAAEPALKEKLHELIGQTVSADDVLKARRLFGEILDVPDGLKIRTLHSFCESVLSRFPLEANIAPHFSVMDDRTAAELMLEARDDLFTRMTNKPNDPLSRAMNHLARLADETGFSDLMNELASKRGTLQNIIEAHNGLKEALNGIRGNLELPTDQTKEDVLANAASDDEIDTPGLQSVVQALQQENGKMAQARAAMLDEWISNKDKRTDTFLDQYVPQFLTKEMKPIAESRLAPKDIRENNPELFEILKNEQSRVMAVIDQLRKHDIMAATETVLQIGTAFSDAYENIKQQRALLDYGDLIQKTLRLLQSEHIVPWVHYKLDGGIDHILIDEAQDTSREQWEIVSYLTSAFFDGEGARDVHRTIFAVGDEKQSIFSFQGADPDAFDAMRRFFADRFESINERLEEIPLAMSFRSAPAILQAVDAIFEQETARHGLSARDQPIRHPPWRTGEAGLVELWPTLKPNEEKDPDPWDAPLDQPSSKSPEIRMAETIAAQIQQWIGNKEILQSAGRPIEPGDIMILVRHRTRFVDELVRALKEKNIAVAGVDRMKLNEQLAIMDLLALGRFVLLPEDDLNLATVLKSPFFGIDDDQLFDLAFERKASLWDSLRDKQKIDPQFVECFETLSSLMDKADYMPPFEFYSHVLDRLDGRRKLLARLGPEALDPINEFMAAALSFEHEHVPSLQSFLYWIDASETEIKRDLEHGRGEVRIMTIHGAKGLQANIVFVPDTCSIPGAQGDPRMVWGETPEDPAVLWRPIRQEEETVSRDLRERYRLKREQEYRRLLYVALTRARDRLYICGFEGKNKPSPDCWYNLIAPVIQANGEEIELPSGDMGWRISTTQSRPLNTTLTAQKETKPHEILPDWVNNDAPPESEPTTPLTPSRQDDDEPPVSSPFGTDDGARFKRGRLIHALLQSLPELAPDRREQAAQTFLAERRHQLSEAEQAEICRETLGILESPDFAFLFAEGSLAEVPLVAEIDGTVISGQVDRLVVTDQSVAVIDYKTNRPPPKTESNVAPIYLKQMAAYQAVLAKIYPGKSIQGYLLWTDGPTLMPLNADILARHAPQHPTP